MSDPDRPSSWWEALDQSDDPVEPVEDPWAPDDGDLELSGEQVQFLESLADQPALPRFTDGLPGLGEPDATPHAEPDAVPEPNAETGD